MEKAIAHSQYAYKQKINTKVEQVYACAKNKIDEVMTSIRLRPEYYKQKLVEKATTGKYLYVKHFWLLTKKVKRDHPDPKCYIGHTDFEECLREYMNQYTPELIALIDHPKACLNLIPTDECNDDYYIILSIEASGEFLRYLAKF